MGFFFLAIVDLKPLAHCSTGRPEAAHATPKRLPWQRNSDDSGQIQTAIFIAMARESDKKRFDFRALGVRLS
jgi:hypothetical protein